MNINYGFLQPSPDQCRRILIVACSQRKILPLDPMQPVRAWDLYDGQAYRLMKALEREGAFPGDVAVWILSAKYKMVLPDWQIVHYDERMTRQRAGEITRYVYADLKILLQRYPSARQLYAWGGKDYRTALRLPHLREDFSRLKILEPTGGLGRQLQQLREWLTQPATPALL